MNEFNYRYRRSLLRTSKNVLEVKKLVSHLSVVFDAVGPLFNFELVAPSEDEVNDHDTDAGYEFHGQTDSVPHDEADKDVSTTMPIIAYIGLNSPRRCVIGIHLTCCYAGQIGDRKHDGERCAALIIGLDVI